MSNPRRKAEAFDAEETMPDDAQERLRKSLQSCLRQALLRLLGVLDMREVGTTKLLAVPLSKFRTLVSVPRIEELACAEQWTALLETLGRRRRTASRRDHFESGILYYEPNLRVQGLPTIVHRPAMTVLLSCTECGHPLRSNWYFVHPGSGKSQVLTPQAGHWSCYKLHQRRCYFRPGDKVSSIVDNFLCLSFCEHARCRKDCFLCDGTSFCTHGKRRRDCVVCASLVKRRKKC